MMRLIVFGPVAVFFFLVMLFGWPPAWAHDPKAPELDMWFEKLSSAAAGRCCHGREAKELDDSDWDMKDAHYRVRLNGGWIDVPEVAVVKEKNLVGRALVWVYAHGGTLTIRCFLPGTMT